VPTAVVGRGWTLAAAVLGSAVVNLDSTIVTVALPRIGEQLPSGLFGTLEGQSYVYNGYLLAYSALIVLAGALNDYYGRRRVFALGLLAFGATSLLCGLAPSLELLVLFRVLQGAAGAVLVPGALALIAATYEGEEEGRAFGVWAGASAGATILGPFAGGILVDAVSWRSAFLINLPLIAVAFWIVRAHVAESRNEHASGRFDWLGAGVVALAIGGLTVGAIYGQQREWQDPLAFAGLALGVAATAAFPLLMTDRRDPLVPLALFRSRNFAVTNLGTLVIYGALYVTFYYLPLFLQGTIGYTAAAVGLATAPGTVFLALFSARFGALAGRYGPRWFMAVGPLVMALGVLWLARVPVDSGAWALSAAEPATLLPPVDYLRDLVPGILLFGLGAMVMVAPLTTALMQSVPEENAGVASAINNAIVGVGPQLAGAAIFVAITATFYAGLASRVQGIDPRSIELRRQISPLDRPAESTSPALASAARDASADAFHLAMLVSAGLLVAGGAINAVGIRDGDVDSSVR
jgi:EmrB/QacA subfamily drug resistance transporter